MSSVVVVFLDVLLLTVLVPCTLTHTQAPIRMHAYDLLIKLVTRFVGVAMAELKTAPAPAELLVGFHFESRRIPIWNALHELDVSQACVDLTISVRDGRQHDNTHM